jgi:hypothetical protein
MATATEFVLPEKYTDDLKDENGHLMSKRYAQQGKYVGTVPTVGQATADPVLMHAASSRSARRQHRRPRRQRRRR